jgi:ergothioneine biosynthesis glutamate--cysteine ligase EgtA
MLADRLARAGLDGVACGTDGRRNPVRVNDTPRYTAMADYFMGAGFMGPASVMMCSTAALQVNVDAGPVEEWSSRVGLAADLGPILIALSACSPELIGRKTGWASSRMRTWAELDPRRTMPITFSDDPALEWATWAVGAPVMMVRESNDGSCSPVRKGVSFSHWITGDVLLGGRRPSWSDLDYHLTTLWPPVRLRGFLELRAADSCPWWAAIAAVAVAVLDDPEAMAIAREACTPIAGDLRAASKQGLASEDIAEAALTCVRAARHALPRLGAAPLVDDVRALEERVLSGGR